MTKLKRNTIIAAAVAVVAVLGTMGAADLVVKTKVCGAIAQMGNPQATTADTPALSTKDTARSAKDAKLMAKLMVFHPSLKDAVVGLAGDAEEAKSISDSGAGLEQLPAILSVMGSMSSHLRVAQHECGLPQRSLFNLNENGPR